MGLHRGPNTQVPATQLQMTHIKRGGAAMLLERAVSTIVGK